MVHFTISITIFFGKAFSFQGIEGGVIVQRNLYLGVYGAFFVTNLKAEVKKDIQYVWVGQGGVNVAYVIQEKSRFHPGYQLNTSYFSFRYDADNFGLYETNNASVILNGLIVSPQIFGELIVTNFTWISTINYYSTNHSDAVKWYSDFLGTQPEFNVPGYAEFHKGDYQHELVLC